MAFSRVFQLRFDHAAISIGNRRAPISDRAVNRRKRAQLHEYCFLILSRNESQQSLFADEFSRFLRRCGVHVLQEVNEHGSLEQLLPDRVGCRAG